MCFLFVNVPFTKCDLTVNFFLLLDIIAGIMCFRLQAGTQQSLQESRKMRLRFELKFPVISNEFIDKDTSLLQIKIYPCVCVLHCNYITSLCYIRLMLEEYILVGRWIRDLFITRKTLKCSVAFLFTLE